MFDFGFDVADIASAAASSTGLWKLSAAVQASERRVCASRSTACAAARTEAESRGAVDDDDNEDAAFVFIAAPAPAPPFVVVAVAAFASLPASLLSAATRPATRARPSRMRRQSAEWEGEGILKEFASKEIERSEKNRRRRGRFFYYFRRRKFRSRFSFRCSSLAFVLFRLP